jgi:hypothetical protein
LIDKKKKWIIHDEISFAPIWSSADYLVPDNYSLLTLIILYTLFFINIHIIYDLIMLVCQVMGKIYII